VLPIEPVLQALGDLAGREQGGEGFLGVRADMPRSSGGAGQGGVTIAEVVPGSPAHRAGIVARDRIVSFDGTPVSGWDHLTEQVSRSAPGRSVAVVLYHEGRERRVDVALADRGHMIWREKQRQIAGGRERVLQRRIEELHHQLELLRHQLASFR
jgi:S1-C subfamily serine protease